MRSPLLVLDVSYLCHRAFHTMKDLSWKGTSTGVTYGFIRSILPFKDMFRTNRIAFCFDGHNLARKVLYPEYKAKRHREMPPEQKAAHFQLPLSIQALRTEHLPGIGFRNIFWHPELESDDFMAAIAYAVPKSQEVILITADADLFQCLRKNVSVFNPQKNRLFIRDWFIGAYGIKPRQWAKVKAISGCHTDNVKGVYGVGEITALKFIRGELGDNTPGYRAIMKSKHIVRRNRTLVELPLIDKMLPFDFRLKKDKITRESWEGVCSNLGMRSIQGQLPICRKFANG